MSSRTIPAVQPGLHSTLIHPPLRGSRAQGSKAQKDQMKKAAAEEAAMRAKLGKKK